jgi:hypothetical protein
MSVSSVASQSVFLNTTPSVTKSSDSQKIVSASSDTSDTAVTSGVNATISTPWGFKVDENGFFGTDFNKAAGIPANVKIHKQQMETVEQYTKIVGSSDDPVKALGKVWSFFSKVAGSTLDSDGSMTIEQVAKMPWSFQSNGSLLDNPISVQNTNTEYTKVNNPSNLIGGMSQNTLDTGLRLFIGGQNSGSQLNQDVSYWKDGYQSEYGVAYDSAEASDQISVGELFGHFCMDSMVLDQTTFDNTRAYYSVLESGQDFKAYLTEKFGAEYVKNISDGIAKAFDDPDMFDTLMKEIDHHMKDDYASYLSSPNTTAGSSLSQNDTSTNSTLSSAYQALKNAKLPTAGSLINIGA